MSAAWLAQREAVGAEEGGWAVIRNVQLFMLL